MLTKNFSLEELVHASSDGFRESLINRHSLEMLQKMRDIMDSPIFITSYWRSPEDNKKVGGVNGSAHLKGYAFDLRCRNGSERRALVSAALCAGFRRIGVAKTFVHVDCDPDLPQFVLWTY